MQISKTKFDGLLLIQPDVYTDERGVFFESWNEKNLTRLGSGIKFVQDNVSFSEKGVLRGLHWQNPNTQAKLLSVLSGIIFDVAVDLRRYSSTFGQVFAAELSFDNKTQVFIPPGFAHGYQVLSTQAVVTYKCTDFYHPESENSLKWNDVSLAIDWPIKNPILSPRDQAAKNFDEICVFETR